MTRPTADEMRAAQEKLEKEKEQERAAKRAMDALYANIDRDLRIYRPDRYTTKASFLDEIAKAHEGKIPEQKARQLLARRLVGVRETAGLKRGNKLLREILATRTIPFDWLGTLSYPIAVRGEHVVLRALSPTDFQNFADDESKAAKGDYAARMATVHAVEFFKEAMEARGLTRFENLDLHDLGFVDEVIDEPTDEATDE